MADTARLDRWECNVLAHARAFRRARGKRDGEAMSRHVLGVLAALRDTAGEPSTDGADVIEGQ